MNKNWAYRMEDSVMRLIIISEMQYFDIVQIKEGP